MSDRQDVVSASKWMALGTIFSRATGFVRSALIFAAIGKSLNADIFNNSNTIPTALYILVAGGIFNVVLVPQLIRAMKKDEDGGDAYVNRVMTLGLLVLAAATVILTLLVPLLVRLVFTQEFFTPEFATRRESANFLMALCMPQVFFYGAFVLVGQILNARGRFGPMMWAPIINNVVACAVLGTYMATFGASDGTDGFTSNEALLLGLGSTLGIAVQTLVLIPYLRGTGFHFRPRFDFRGVGLGHTLRLGMWTLFFIMANQVAFVAIQNIGTRSTVSGASSGVESAGAAVYEFGFLISQVPHGIITVSLATAMMPTLSALAADHRLPRMRLEIGRTLRLALVIVGPLAVAVACLGQQAATVTTSWGAIKGNTDLIGHTIQAFAPAMVLFTIHYLMLRGFYAAENTRTPFFIQVVIAATNIAAAVILTSLVGTQRISTMLALSYGIAYLVGSALSTTLLSRLIGPIFDAEMWRFMVRMTVACAVSAATMLGLLYGLSAYVVDKSTIVGGLVVLIVAGGAGAGVFLLAAKLLHIEEIAYLASTLLRRRAAPD
ncbi:MAG: murein biosynthesis integral membrane protein MurJ [Actinomycetota bacterium]|nr:murein biosynthesis integral membrane protein MurJ [Actinomycetota bacterium]